MKHWKVGKTVMKSKKGDITKKKENIKYDAAYISYVESGESAAVFITRDIVNAVDTKGKWVDVLFVNGSKNYDDQWDFKEFAVEIFPRRKNPVYPKDASDEEKKYITWKTAHEDIDEQREASKKGIKFRIMPKLVNKNHGKYKTMEIVWNRTRQCLEPWEKGISSSCEIKKCRVPVKPEWEYYILALKRLDFLINGKVNN